MKPAMLRNGPRSRRLSPSAIALAIAAVVGATSIAPVWARDDDHDRGREVSRYHGDRHRDTHYRHRGYSSYESPSYVYAPPPVYYAPPPGPPAIDFIIPLRFR
ncbi:MAG TPA: hypothetical protein VET85_13495 [Stellaceae bacterium]|nr:hypothetical protein [Stellaceae bacterium]